MYKAVKAGVGQRHEYLLTDITREDTEAVLCTTGGRRGVLVHVLVDHVGLKHVVNLKE